MRGKHDRRTGAAGRYRQADVGFTYEVLAFHIADSKSLQRFMLIGIADKGFKKSVLCKTIKAISPETWKAVNKVLIHYAQIEKGREVRIDCTVVESNIHEPTDSSLLFDSVRVLSRLLSNAKEVYGLPIILTDHTRRAKRRNLGILNAKGKKDPKKHYQDLLKVTEKTMAYVIKAIETIDNTVSAGMGLVALRSELDHYQQQLAAQVMRGLKNPTDLRFYYFHQFFRKGPVKPTAKYT